MVDDTKKSKLLKTNTSLKKTKAHNVVDSYVIGTLNVGYIASLGTLMDMVIHIQKHGQKCSGKHLFVH
jgi:hypothetical protein